MHTYTANVVYGDVWSKAGSCFEGKAVIEEAKAQGHFHGEDTTATGLRSKIVFLVLPVT